MEHLSADTYLTRQGQAQRLLEAAKRLEWLDKARYYAALVQLAGDVNFEVVLLHTYQTLFLLKPAETQFDYGEQRLFLRLLKDMREAEAHGVYAADQAARL